MLASISALVRRRISESPASRVSFSACASSSRPIPCLLEIGIDGDRLDEQEMLLDPRRYGPHQSTFDLAKIDPVGVEHLAVIGNHWPRRPADHRDPLRVGPFRQ